MMSKPKQMVIDKDALVRIKLNDLCAFAGDHILLLCDTLWYECATTSTQSPELLVAKCVHVVEGGGYVCSYNHALLLQWEGKHDHPFPTCLMDLAATTAVRNKRVRCDEMPNSKAAQEALESRKALATQMLAVVSRELKDVLDLERPETVKCIKAFQGSRCKRLELFLQAIDRSDIRQMAIILCGDWIGDVGKFRVSCEWIAWHFVRLIQALTLEYCYVRQTGGSRDMQAEHDLQDAEYVLLLSRADGIISNDKALAELARVAFPGKDVFSSLEEVPDSYRCDWTNQ